MELNGKCVAIIGATEYTKKTGERDMKHGFVLEVKAGDYINKVAFNVFGDSKFKGMGIVEGGTYNVAFNLDSRSFNGKWYTDATAFRVARLDSGQNVAQAQTVRPDTVQNGHVSQGTQGDIPF